MQKYRNGGAIPLSSKLFGESQCEKYRRLSEGRSSSQFPSAFKFWKNAGDEIITIHPDGTTVWEGLVMTATCAVNQYPGHEGIETLGISQIVALVSGDFVGGYIFETSEEEVKIFLASFK